MEKERRAALAVWVLFLRKKSCQFLYLSLFPCWKYSLEMCASEKEGVSPAGIHLLSQVSWIKGLKKKHLDEKSRFELSQLRIFLQPFAVCGVSFWAWALFGSSRKCCARFNQQKERQKQGKIQNNFLNTCRDFNLKGQESTVRLLCVRVRNKGGQRWHWTSLRVQDVTPLNCWEEEREAHQQWVTIHF